MSEPVMAQYFYRSVASSRRHRHQVSVYLVQHLSGSVVVARIEPLGLVDERHGEHELVIEGLRRNLVLTGRWHRTRGERHARVRVGPARAGNDGVVASRNGESVP